MKNQHQYRAVEFPIRSVGVQGDSRTYRRVAALTGPLDYRMLSELSVALCNNSGQYNRVVVMVAGDAEKLSQAEVRPASTTGDRLDLLRDADEIMRTTMERYGLTDSVWQFPTVLIPVSLEGGESVVLRPVNSEDGMTANYAQIPIDVLLEIGQRIKHLPGIDAVFLDVTDKPPSTIEWE
jgi:GMP synthase (glutamine-hydrolysing)